MEDRRRKHVNVGMLVLAFLAMGILFVSYAPAIAKDKGPGSRPRGQGPDYL